MAVYKPVVRYLRRTIVNYWVRPRLKLSILAFHRLIDFGNSYVHSIISLVYGLKPTQRTNSRAGRKIEVARSVVQSLGLLLALTSPVASALPQADVDNGADSAWLSFQHVLGQPAAIGANADHALANELWRPIPEVDPDQLDAADLRKFHLGFRLFHEGRLSSADSIACISCHAGPQGAVDGLRFSRGVNRALGHFNSLSLFNADFHFRQFWDGRAITLKDQALEPVTNVVEMANTLEAVRSVLEQDPIYKSRFEAVYPDGVTVENMSDALAHFQRINFTRTDSAFMRYLEGQPDALSEQVRRGMQSFQRRGCATCHNGMSLGGNSYQQLGALIPYYGADREPGINDEGVHRRTGRTADLHVFKVPSLHAVAATAPYFHDGSAPTLEAAVKDMARHQLAVELDQDEVDDIVAFLRELLPAPELLAVDISQVEEGEPGVRPHSDASQHLDIYRTVADEMEPTYQKLLHELERVLEGQVLHFDFVQFQHLELIRRARALQFPPVSLDTERQNRLAEQASALVEKIVNLEWPISDLLRNHVVQQITALYRDSGDAALPVPGLAAIEAEHESRARRAKEQLEQADISANVEDLRVFISM